MESELPRNALYILNASVRLLLKQYFIAAEYWTQSSEHVFNMYSHNRKIVLSHPNTKPRLCIFTIYLWVRSKLKFRRNISQSCNKAVTNKTWKKKCITIPFFQVLCPLNFLPTAENHFEEHKLCKIRQIDLIFSNIS